MTKSNRNPASPPATGSTNSTKVKPAATSSGPEALSAAEFASLRQEFKEMTATLKAALSPAEINSLRQEAQAAHALIQAELAKRRD